MARSLDIAERQILCDFPDDGILYHHRVLFCRIDGAIWPALSPDLEFARHDLSEIRHHILERAVVMPAFAAGAYIFDPITQAEITQFKCQAKIRASLLGGADIPEAAESYWRDSDPNSASFGEKIVGLIMQELLLRKNNQE